MAALVGERWVILAAFWLTLKLTVVSAAGSVCLGTALAVARVSPLWIARAAGTLYVNAVRNTPLTLVVILCGHGLQADLGLSVSANLSVDSFAFASLGLTLYTAAFVCEAIRSGINTVPSGQAEAAAAIGLTYWQGLRLVVLPQAFRAVIAPLGSILIALTKNTTVAAAVGVGEASLTMKDLFEQHGDAIIPLFLGFAAGFLALTLPTGLLFGRLARRQAVLR